METQKDFRELLASFNGRGVEYLIVGGYALAFHGVPRFTGDLDLLLGPGVDNARRVVAALGDFGLDSLGIETKDFEQPDRVVQIGVPPVRVDLLTSITGVTWADAVRGRAPGTYGDVLVHYIGRQDLVANKRATGRKRDLADLEALGEL